jgi:RimJ/RimL family protein N-acetyltransferase
MANTTYMTLERIPYEIDAEGVTLRAYDPRDPREAERLFEAIDSSRSHLEQFLIWVSSHRVVADSARWIRESRASFEAMTNFDFGVFAKDDGRLLGGAALHVRGQPEVVCLEIGYWTRASEQNKGVAREAARALTRVAFDLAACDRVVIRADSANAASRRIPERLGYRLEGIARNGLRLGGLPRDAAIYALVRDQPPRP